MQRLIRDPLVHFFMLGGALFAFYHFALKDEPRGEDPRTIVVDEESLLEFMQFRSRAFDEKVFRQRLADMPPEARRQLIDDFIREEVLYREARAMGLDENDYIIRRRLVQKVEFVTESLSRKTVALTEEDVAAYFEAHRDEYTVQPHITFTHVFIDGEREGAEAARERAARLLEELNHEPVPFEEAVRYGDRFPFHLNYVDRTREFVASHFGEPMAATLFETEYQGSAWQGPFTSPYGSHLVLITERSPGRPARLEEIEGRVREDAETQHKNEIMRQTLDDMIERYDIQFKLPPPE